MDLSEHLQLGQTLQGVSSALNITEQGSQCLSSQHLMWKSFFLVHNLPGLFCLCTTVHRWDGREINLQGFQKQEGEQPW